MAPNASDATTVAAKPVGQSSIGLMPDWRAEAARLAANAVDVLPAGALAEQLELGRPLRVKLGIDPTTPDIHLGHTVVLSKLREFQEAGHLVVLIIGDFTARVGDPSGRTAQRPVLTEEQIGENARTYQEQAFKVLDRDRTEVRCNSEWLEMSSGELLQLLSRATVAQLLERDIFERRMRADEPISALELLYPLLQGYDSVAVDADVELGGTDQKFNLLFARDVQSAYGKGPQSIITMPLLVGIDGSQKMSKSLGNSVGVTEAPEEMFGRLMRIPDQLMPEYFRLLLASEVPAGEPNEAKRELARRIVARYYDDSAAEAAERHFDRLHVDHQPPESIEEAAIRTDGPLHLPALLSDQFGLSRSEARRLIEQGGVRIDGQVVDGGQLDLPLEGLDGAVVQVGKRRHRRLRILR
jgi:tyrosyl-tRNA synthetase